MHHLDICHGIIIHVNEEAKILYVEIPKAGCTSIKTELFFKPKYGLPKADVSVHTHLGYKKVFNLAKYKDYFKFTVTRDPYARFLSFFNDKILNGTEGGRSLTICKKYCKIVEFNDIQNPNDLLLLLNKRILFCDSHICPQYYLLPRNLHDLDFIGQIENMDEVNKVLSSNLGKKIVIPHFHKSNYEKTFSVDVDKDLFNYIYRKDYEIFKDRYKPLS